MHTITGGTTTVTPDAVQRYDSARESRNIVHDILGREDSDVTMRPASLRAGTLELVFFSAAAAVAAETLHAAGVVLALVSDVEGVSMSYVPVGRIGRAQESSTRAAWIVTVEYKQVAS